ncbi:unnamed protein product [Dovyalis caffra]|uniref:Uncharacterized protein n=1 Tax=Dovyalis caffra TaxID=77055 RepID=A0AAV1SR56_9ROSI|nr:unnamed protein product [Dovyalis caffra]
MDLGPSLAMILLHNFEIVASKPLKRGKFMKLVVYMDLVTLVKASIKVEDRDQQACYECSPHIRCTYSRIGHNSFFCPTKKTNCQQANYGETFKNDAKKIATMEPISSDWMVSESFGF